MQTYPNLKAIIAPTSVGIVAAAQAVTDAGKIGKINVTGLGLPSEMAAHVEVGRVEVLRDLEPDRPRLCRDDDRLQPVQRHGQGRSRAARSRWAAWATSSSTTSCEGAMADPFTYDASNIDEFSTIF